MNFEVGRSHHRKHLFAPFRSLAHRLHLSYFLVFFVVLAVAMASTYGLLSRALRTDIQQALEFQIALIRQSIETGFQASLRSYFRSIVDLTESAVEEAYQRFELGILSEEEAQTQALGFLSQIEVGTDGYCVVIDAEGRIIYHPEDSLVGEDANQFDFIHRILDVHENFFYYDWTEPGTQGRSLKMMFSRQTPYWGWAIAVTGYRDELGALISIEDFEDGILAINFGETGYPIVHDYQGTFLIHPQYQGVNMAERPDSMGDIVRKAMSERNGTAEYRWRNPDESRYRKKITVFADIPDLGFIVAATAYKSEFTKPLRQLGILMLVIHSMSLVMILLLTSSISRSITKPIVHLKNQMDVAASGNLDVRAEITSSDEIGLIESHFNGLMAQLREQQRDLKTTNQELLVSVEELHRTQERLLQEERFSNMGRLIARISHHLNTPLGVAVTAATHLSSVVETSRRQGDSHDDEEDPYQEAVETLTVLEESLYKTVALVNSFRRLNLDGAIGEVDQIDLKAFLEDIILREWKVRLPISIRIEADCPGDIRLRSFPEALRIVFGQLIDNSLKHSFKSPKSGKILITCRSSEEDVVVEYADTGEGIPQKHSHEIFEPFFNSDSTYRASGIGLNIVFILVVSHMGGTIHYGGSRKDGVRYIMTLPNLPARAESADIKQGSQVRRDRESL